VAKLPDRNVLCTGRNTDTPPDTPPDTPSDTPSDTIRSRANSLSHPRFFGDRPHHPCGYRTVVRNTVTTTIETSDGEQLEAMVTEGPNAQGIVVLCHPHPLHGGTMRAPILGAITKACTTANLNVVRFNFRGVGESTGVHGNGETELHDVDAAVSLANEGSPPLVGIAGWSFGAAVALRWQAATASSINYCGIAPPVGRPLSTGLPKPDELADATRTFVVGNRDQLIDVDALVAYAASIDADIIRYETADHFFVFRHDRLATDVVQAMQKPS
jgi:alpha/beta superfamily hydrolase